MTMAEDISIAFLGPKGTYGHQAAIQLSSSLPHPTANLSFIPCRTIPEIYTASASYLVMPLQNTIHGVVLETVDSLLSPLRAGPSTSSACNGSSLIPAQTPTIIDSIDLGIRHCLVARKGTRMDDIKVVRSHEQALGQSATFLQTHLSGATLQPWSSTAAAAASILDDSLATSIESQPSHAADEAIAAICSKAVIAELDGLEVLYEGTQGIDNNYTRFLLLSRLPPTDSPKAAPPNQYKPNQVHFFALPTPAAFTSLPSGRIKTIHSRPLVHIGSTDAPTILPQPSIEDPTQAAPNAQHLRTNGTLTAERYPAGLLVEIETTNPPIGAMQEKGILYLGSLRP